MWQGVCVCVHVCVCGGSMVVVVGREGCEIEEIAPAAAPGTYIHTYIHRYVVMVLASPGYEATMVHTFS